MPKTRTVLSCGIVAALLAALGVAALFLDRGEAAGTPKVIYMSAVEHKGGTSTEPFPSATPPPGGGHLLNPPDATGRWETSTYRWEPGTIVVDKGDEVELWIWGVNGSQHPSTIEGYVPQFTVTRGNLTVVKFTADKEGIFRITCHAHPPPMEAQLVVLGAVSQQQPTTSASPTATPTAAPAQLPGTGGEPGDTNGVEILIALAFAAVLVTGLILLRTIRSARR